MTAEGWLYLAVVLGPFTRRVVGWAIPDDLGHQLALAAPDTFAILTSDANEKLRALHDRVPAVLPRVAWAAWLREGPAAPPDLAALLRPCPSECFRRRRRRCRWRHRSWRRTR